MSDQRKVLLQISNEVRGPFGADAVRELLEVRAISESTFVSDSESGPWVSLGRHPFTLALLPQTKTWGFKAAEFERANSAESEAVDHRDIIRTANLNAPGWPPKHEDSNQGPNEVQAWLREVVSAAEARSSPPANSRRRYRKLRDYLILIAIGDGFGAILLILFRHYTLLLIGVWSYMTLFTSVMTWTVWTIIDRY